MKGHNYGFCLKCGKFHKHPKGGRFAKRRIKIRCKNPNCSKLFEVQKARAKYRKYCSKQCQAQHRKELGLLKVFVQGHPMFKGVEKGWFKKSQPRFRLPLSEETREKIRNSLYHQNLRGENNAQWKGGIAHLPYPYEFYQIRKRILERDNYSCRASALSRCGGKLCVHHIDGDKNNNSDANLITLCSNHHGRALVPDFNRKIRQLMEILIRA